MAPSTQKALILDSKFGNFVVETIDVPKPGPGEILIRNHAVSLNPVDWKIRKFGIYVDKFPAILGGDISGDVVEIGEGVTNVAVGDGVFLQGLFGYSAAGYQQYAAGKADIVAKIPPNLTYDDAATLNISLVAAYLSLFNKDPHGLGIPNPLVVGRGKSAGQTLVILGGSGSVGQFAIQLAKLAGFSNIITTASPKHADHLRSLGATHVIDRNTPEAELSLEVSKISGGQPLKFVFDAVSSPETQQIGYNLLAQDGHISIVGRDWIKTKNYEASVVLYNNLTTLLEEGAIKPVSFEVISNGLAGIPDGLKRLEENKVSRGKLVARPQETP